VTITDNHRGKLRHGHLFRDEEAKRNRRPLSTADAKVILPNVNGNLTTYPYPSNPDIILERSRRSNSARLELLWRAGLGLSTG
jgi:hypothetical protein